MPEMSTAYLLGILLITQRKHISKLFDRDVTAKAEVPGVSIEMSAKTHRLMAVVEEAAQPTQSLVGLVGDDQIDQVMEQDATERRRDIERVAREAALWGQYMAEAMPHRPGMYWTPLLQWQPDGSVNITYGKRSGPDPDGPNMLIAYDPDHREDAQSNDSR